MEIEEKKAGVFGNYEFSKQLNLGQGYDELSMATSGVHNPQNFNLNSRDFP